MKQPARVTHVDGSGEQAWTQLMDLDAIGRNWGGEDAGHPAGLSALTNLLQLRLQRSRCRSIDPAHVGHARSRRRRCAGFQKALACHRQVGNEEGLAITYSQFGKTLLLAGRNSPAEKCLNNATEHFVKLGNEQGEAAALRLLADLYEQRSDLVSAARCLERIVQIGQRYGLPSWQEDAARLQRIQTLRPHSESHSARSHDD